MIIGFVNVETDPRLWYCKTWTGLGPKLCVLSHNYGDLCYWLHIYFLILLLSSHKQDQNMSMHKWWASSFSYYELHTFTSKQSTKSLSTTKQLCIQTKTHYKGRRCVLRSQTPLYILTQRKQVKNLPKVILHIINLRKQNHMFPHEIPHLINPRKQIKNLPKVILHIIYAKETKSHVSPWDSTFN
jgi:hypothetical protein